MKKVLLTTLFTVFAGTAAMAHHPYYGSNGGVREVVAVYTQKTYEKTFRVVEVETVKPNGSVKTKKFYYHVESGKWWNAKGSKFKSLLPLAFHHLPLSTCLLYTSPSPRDS